MRKKSIALAALLALVLGFSNCKNAAQNSNQQQAGQTSLPVSKARWVAKFRSPSSQNIKGVNLATFSYSSISIVSPNVIFAAGDMPHPVKKGDDRVGVVVRTTDGGESWKEFLIEHPGTTIPVLNAIHFVSPTTGWIAGVDAGRSGVVLKTTDGGESWAFSRLSFKQIPTSLFFVDEQTGWMGGVSAPTEEDEDSRGEASDLLFTNDGGRTWQSQRRLSLSITDIFFLDRMTGWVSGYRGSIYHTTDGGRSWDVQKSELETPDNIPNRPEFDASNFIIQGVWFFDAQNGFAAASNVDGNAGRALGTTNGGKVWSQKWIVPDSGVKDVAMISPSEAWAIVQTSGYVYRTVDAGRTWLAEPVEFEQSASLYKLAATGSNAWAAGGGAIFKRVE